MKTNRIIIGSLSALLSGSLMAGAMGPVQDPWSQVFTLSLGPTWAEAGNTQTFFLHPQIEKTYTVENKTSTLLDGELFYGVQHAIVDNFAGQVGIALAGSGTAKVAGEIWDDADPVFNNYAYSYKINHGHVAVKGKLLAQMWPMLMPYLSGSVGVGFNRAYGYTNTPLIFEAVVNPNFASNTQTTFTYTVGAGIQTAINQNWQVGLGYEFADWGQTQLGRAFGQTLGTGLATEHLYTNGLLFNVTYVL